MLCSGFDFSARLLAHKVLKDENSITTAQAVSGDMALLRIVQHPSMAVSRGFRGMSMGTQTLTPYRSATVQLNTW